MTSEPTNDTAPASDLLLIEVHDRIATLTLNRPEAPNALSAALILGSARTRGYAVLFEAARRS